jgi:hypothetical protein
VITTLKLLSLFSFLFFLILDYLINNNYLGHKIKKFYFKFIGLNYFSIAFILTCIVFLILTIFSYFGFSLFCFDSYLFDIDLFKNMSDSGVNTNVKAEGTVNINHPNLNVSIPASSLNNLPAATSVSQGGALALKVMQQVPGEPFPKAVAGAATFLGAQALTVAMSKILNSNNSSNNSNNTKNLSN